MFTGASMFTGKFQADQITTNYASKEVILSTGALDTPRIFMHSGIGSENEHAEYKIPLVHNFPAVGQGLRDHCSVTLVHLRNGGTSNRQAFYGD